MKIENKSIIENNIKKCMVCDGECENGTLTILGRVICSKCVDKITTLDLDNPEYYKLKESIKKNIIEHL